MTIPFLATLTVEFDCFGVYFSPFVPRFIIAGLLWIPLHRLLVLLQVQRWAWHPPLFHLAAFILLLTGVTFYWHP